MSIRINDHILAGNEFYGYTTNRILEIPQDIKLELNNGTLTLKAGSKTYKADGTLEIVPSDINYHFTGTTVNNLILIYDSSVNSMGVYIQGTNAISSATAPSTGVADTLWFDTTNNKCMITHDNAVTWTEIPLPIGLTSCNTTDGFTSVDQIFNGFGYIGSTVFALPGVKCQFADGRNDDGTCKSIVTTTTEVNTFTPGFGSTNIYNIDVWLRSDGTLTATNLFYYDSYKNQIIFSFNNTAYTNACIATFDWLDGKIVSWKPYTVDSMINSNASNFSQAGRSYLSGLGMPSGRYIDLTLGASGSTYTAPANGWFAFYCESICDSRIVTKGGLFGNTALGKSGFANNNTVSVLKGDTVILTYSEPIGSSLRFYYCEGEE